MAKIYRTVRLVHDEQPFEHNIEMGIVQTPNTTAYTESTESMKSLPARIWMMKEVKETMQPYFLVISMSVIFMPEYNLWREKKGEKLPYGMTL